MYIHPPLPIWANYYIQYAIIMDIFMCTNHVTIENQQNLQMLNGMFFLQELNIIFSFKTAHFWSFFLEISGDFDFLG